MKGLLIANGKMVNAEFYLDRMKAEVYDLVVCADGGANNAYKFGIMPHAIVGDMDSIHPDVREYYESTDVEFQCHPPEKDETDTEIALEYLIGAGCRSLDMFGCLGNRVDHALANVYLLVEMARKGVKARLIDETNELEVLLSSEKIQTKPGEIISLIPLSEKVEEVTLEGFAYPLVKETLNMGYSRGISNIAKGSEAVIEFSRGVLLVGRVKEE